MAMKRYTPEELAEVLRLHKLWLDDEEEGVRANLAGANLHGAYLAGADLAEANLAGAYLDGANLAGAYLDGANLAGANLAGANLAGAFLDGAYLVRAYLDGADLAGAGLAGANLAGAFLDGAYLAGAYLDGANLDGAYLAWANLDGANLDGAYLDGANRIFSLEVFSSLYKYTCWAFATVEGVPWVRMGCLWKTVDEWDKVGIRKSNLREFPDNGSETSERRARAFEFTRTAAVSLAEKAKANPLKLKPEPVPPVSKGDLVQLADAARERWPWAPTGEGRVDAVMNGWILIEYPERYLRAPYAFVVPAASVTKEGVPA